MHSYDVCANYGQQVGYPKKGVAIEEWNGKWAEAESLVKGRGEKIRKQEMDADGAESARLRMRTA